jgi:hypothetical protein
MLIASRDGAIRLTTADIVSAFEVTGVIGTKVHDQERCLETLFAAIAAHDSASDRVPGQHFIVLPPEANRWVSAGVGRRTQDPRDYVLRLHRGRVTAFLRRQIASEVEKVAVVVYTAAAYLSDPEVAADQNESARVRAIGATHVVVAVLAFAGPKAPLTPYRLVINLAGGNKEALAWTVDEIRGKARESKAYWDEWEVVAD